MYTCDACGASSQTPDGHVCPLGGRFGGGMRPVPTDLGALPDPAVFEMPDLEPVQTVAPSLLDLLSVDEEKLDRVLAKLERLQGLIDQGVMEKLERLAQLASKVRL